MLPQPLRGLQAELVPLLHHLVEVLVHRVAFRQLDYDESQE